MYICDIRLPPPLPAPSLPTEPPSPGCFLGLPATRPQLFSRLPSLLPSHTPGSLFQISNILAPTPFSFKVPRPSTLPVLAVPVQTAPPPRKPQVPLSCWISGPALCPGHPRPTPLPLSRVASQVSVFSQAPDLPESASHIPLPGQVPSQGGLPSQSGVRSSPPLPSPLVCQDPGPPPTPGAPQLSQGQTQLRASGPRPRGLLSGAGPPPASRPIPTEKPTRGSSRRGFRFPQAGLREIFT